MNPISIVRALIRAKREIVRKLHHLEQGNATIMSTLEDIQASQAVTDAKLATVAADVATLLAKIAAVPPAGLTPEQQAAIDDIAIHAGKINDSLSGIDASANPAPTAAAPAGAPAPAPAAPAA